MRVFVEKGGGKEDKNLMQKSLFSRRKGHQNWLTSYVNDSEPLFKVLINHKITRTCRIVGLGGTWSHFRFFGNFYHLFQFIMTPSFIKNFYKATNPPPSVPMGCLRPPASVPMTSLVGIFQYSSS